MFIPIQDTAQHAPECNWACNETTELLSKSSSHKNTSYFRGCKCNCFVYNNGLECKLLLVIYVQGKKKIEEVMYSRKYLP